MRFDTKKPYSILTMCEALSIEFMRFTPYTFFFFELIIYEARLIEPNEKKNTRKMDREKLSVKKRSTAQRAQVDTVLTFMSIE